MILTDLQKDLDTINHEIILGKSHATGLSEKTVTWFESYLSDLAFKFNINNLFSDLSKISCSFSQESILEPLLFLLYVNDMPQAVHSDYFSTWWRQDKMHTFRFEVKLKTLENLP